MNAKSICIIALALVASTSITGRVAAQGSQPAKVTSWNDPNQSFKLIYRNGNPIEQFDDGATRVAVFGVRREGKRLCSVVIGVYNRRGPDIDVDPETFRAFTANPASTQLAWVDAGILLAKQRKSAERHARFAAAMSGFAAGAATNTAYVNNSDGSTSTVTYPNSSAIAVAEEGADANQRSINERYGDQSSEVLRHNTLSAGQMVMGRVYFSSPAKIWKKAYVEEVDVPLRGMVYRFLWGPGALAR